MSEANILRPVWWEGEIPGTLCILDQTRLPNEERILRCQSVAEVRDAIARLAVRGAPAIGVAGAYGVTLGIQTIRGDAAGEIAKIASTIANARPTAVNLAWAVERTRTAALDATKKNLAIAGVAAAALAEARAIDLNNRERCEKMGALGAELLHNGDAVVTHCNTGPLATAGIGTALGVVAVAARQGKRIHVYANETRPLLQGARITAYELLRWGVPVTVATDGMAARLMETRKIAAVLVGADRIAANGDTANKIGTHTLAIVAARFGVPFYVVAPLSTFDRSLPDGRGIPIEERSVEEVTSMGGVRVVPEGVAVFNPAFDVTPASLIHGIITEAGIASPPTRQTIDALFQVRE